MMDFGAAPRCCVRASGVALAATLAGLAPVGAQEQAGDAAAGERLFHEHACYSCHGFNGQTGARDLVGTNSPLVADFETFLTFLRLRGDQAPLFPSTRMPNYPESALDDAAARDIYAFIRSFELDAPDIDTVPALQAILESAATATGDGGQAARRQRINGRPNLNGIWQAANTAYWNLEAHSAEALPQFWQLGALGAIPAGQSVVVGGTIPYLAESLAQREKNRAGWPAADPVVKCYMPGIPRATYMPFPFEIVQGDGDMLFVYEFASANRAIYMDEQNHLSYEEVPVDQWMGWSNGRWDGDTLVVEVVANDDRTWLDRAGNYHSSAMTVTERYTLAGDDHIEYEATIEDPNVFARPWTIAMPLYRRIEPHAETLEYKCVEFAEPLLYGEFLKNPLR